MRWIIVVILPFAALLAGASGERVPRARAQRALIALGAITDPDVLRVDLGRALFHDPMLSSNGKVSCETCHPLNTGGTTREPLPKQGVSGEPAPFNTPTIWNATVTPRLGWRGDAGDVGTVVERALTKSFLMGNKSVDDVAARLAHDPQWSTKFARANIKADRDGIANALGAYLAYLTPKNLPADRYFAGDENAISVDAKKGAALFRSLGCVSCHAGTTYGGSMITRFGITVDDPYADRGQCDDGSFCRSDSDCRVSGGGECRATHVVRTPDRGVDPSTPYLFRVPSLRCVGETAPYFHDGSARTLDEAVRVMARLQLGKTLSDDEAHSLVSFLDTLSGSIPAGEI